MKKISALTFLLILLLSSCNNQTNKIISIIEVPNIPVLALKEDNPVLKMTFVRMTNDPYIIHSIDLQNQSTDYKDIVSTSIYVADSLGRFAPKGQLLQKVSGNRIIHFKPDFTVNQDTFRIWVCVQLKDSLNLKNRIDLECSRITTNRGFVGYSKSKSSKPLRVGVALRQHMQDGVDTYRIPGLITSKKGTLLAIYDIRRNGEDDLQGDIDIGLSRSQDGGATWSNMQTVLDMGEWGGLPQRYNGVSDACILSDDHTGDLYVAGLWMHGVIDPTTRKFVNHLNNDSTIWNHQWRKNGSLPGFDVKHSSQFMMVKSLDDGKTWSKPINLTSKIKKAKWHLLAPAPGHGITLTNGNLVMPVEGKDENEIPFSTIMSSSNHGKTWKVGNPASHNTNECMAAELSDGSIMLNMRDRSNRNKIDGNGRAISVSSDLGKTWTEHNTSHKALIEPACMAALHKHIYTENGEKKQCLLFFNPNSVSKRNHLTLKVSFDDGQSWSQSNWIELDEWSGNGYSCITSIDEQTIGILYEGSQADMVFQQITLDEIINKNN